MEQIIVDSYFDISDYTTPVKQFLTDSWISFRPGNSVVTINFFKKCLLNLDDSIFGLFDTMHSDYFYMQSTVNTFLSDTHYGPGEGVYFYQIFKLDSQYDIYQRQVYTIIGVF